MDKTQIEARLGEIAIETRSLLESVKNTAEKVDLDEVRAKKAALEEERSKLEKEFAQLQAPAEGENRGTALAGLTNADFAKLATGEKRSITIGSNGLIEQIKNLVETTQEKDSILDLVSYDYGPNAATNIPVLEPTLADPDGYAEGTDSVTEDSTAALTTTEIQPLAYSSVLAVTAEQVTMGSIDFVAKLPELFRKAFRRKMHTGLMTGTGTSKAMKGIFVSALANTDGVTELASGQTAILCSDLAGLALQVQGLDADYEIVMNPTVYQAILADSTDGEDTKEYKTTLIRDKMIEGVPVRLDKKAPTDTSAGAILAAAVPLNRYHIGVAGEVVIDTIKVKGDTKTYYQATAFFSGKQVTDSDIYSLAVASA